MMSSTQITKELQPKSFSIPASIVLVIVSICLSIFLYYVGISPSTIFYCILIGFIVALFPVIYEYLSEPAKIRLTKRGIIFIYRTKYKKFYGLLHIPKLLWDTQADPSTLPVQVGEGYILLEWKHIGDIDIRKKPAFIVLTNGRKIPIRYEIGVEVKKYLQNYIKSESTMHRKIMKSIIIFQGDVDAVKKWRIRILHVFWGTYLILMVIGGLVEFEDPFFIVAGFLIGILFFIVIIGGLSQPLRITERGIYPPTRGILNLFLIRERFIPFSEIKEFRVYNLTLEKFPERLAKRDKRKRKEQEILKSKYDIVLKNGKIIKMNGWITALSFRKNLPSVKKMREFRDILLKINKELEKGKTIIRKEDIMKEDLVYR